MVEHHVVGGVLPGGGAHREVGGGVQHLGDAGAGGGAPGAHDEDAGDGHHGVEDDGEVAEKGDDVPGGAGAGVDPDGPHHDDQGEAQIQKQVHHGVGEGHGDARLLLPADHLPVDLGEVLPLVLGFGQRLDDPDAGGVLPHHADHVVHPLLELDVQGDAPFGHQVHQHPQKGQGAHQHQGEHGVQGEGDEDAADEQDGGPHPHALHHADHLVDVVGVAGEAGLQGGDGELVDLVAGEVGDLLEQVVADGLGGVLGHPGGHAVGHNVGDQGADGRQHHGPAPQQDELHVPQGHHVVDEVGENPGQHQLHDRADELDGDAQGHPGHEGFEIVEDHPHNVQPPAGSFAFPQYSAE